jgi:hypothetical protein
LLVQVIAGAGARVDQEIFYARMDAGPQQNALRSIECSLGGNRAEVRVAWPKADDGQGVSHGSALGLT